MLLCCDWLRVQQIFTSEHLGRVAQADKGLAGLPSRVLFPGCVLFPALPFCFPGSVPELPLKRGSNTTALPPHHNWRAVSVGLRSHKVLLPKLSSQRGYQVIWLFMLSLRSHCLWWLLIASLLWKKRGRWEISVEVVWAHGMARSGCCVWFLSGSSWPSHHWLKD